MLTRIASLVFCALGVSLFAGCSPYVDDFHYAPHPAVAEIQVATTQPSQAAPAPVTVYATIVGIRREDRDQHIPLSVEVRLRLDNHSAQNVNFDPHTMDLSTGELVRFAPPLVPTQIIPIVSDQPVVVQANFPFPQGFSYDNLSLENLQLHWSVSMDGHPVQQVANFRRVFRYYDEYPYWGYAPYGYAYPYPYYAHPYFGFGTAVVIRR